MSAPVRCGIFERGRYQPDRRGRSPTGITMNNREGTVLVVGYDSQHRFSKQPRRNITLIEGYGVEGDAHAGQYAKHGFSRRWLKVPNRRQVHLIRSELFADLQATGHLVGPGDL